MAEKMWRKHFFYEIFNSSENCSNCNVWRGVKSIEFSYTEIIRGYIRFTRQKIINISLTLLLMTIRTFVLSCSPIWKRFSLWYLGQKYSISILNNVNRICLWFKLGTLQKQHQSEYIFFYYCPKHDSVWVKLLSAGCSPMKEGITLAN